MVALYGMETSIPMAHHESARQVAWLLLSVLQKQVVTTRDQMRQAQQLKQVQEALEERVHALEKALEGQVGSPFSSSPAS